MCAFAVVEEQAEEDIIRVVDEETDIKREIEESESNMLLHCKFLFFFLQIKLKRRKHECCHSIII